MGIRRYLFLYIFPLCLYIILCYISSVQVTGPIGAALKLCRRGQTPITNWMCEIIHKNKNGPIFGRKESKWERCDGQQFVNSPHCCSDFCPKTEKGLESGVCDTTVYPSEINPGHLSGSNSGSCFCKQPGISTECYVFTRDDAKTGYNNSRVPDIIFDKCEDTCGPNKPCTIPGVAWDAANWLCICFCPDKFPPGELPPPVALSKFKKVTANSTITKKFRKLLGRKENPPI